MATGESEGAGREVVFIFENLILNHFLLLFSPKLQTAASMMIQKQSVCSECSLCTGDCRIINLTKNTEFLQDILVQGSLLTQWLVCWER